MISVIIPTYNRYDYLCNAIKSVKEQTYENKEIIVVDDCSTDSRYCSKNISSPVRYIRLNPGSKDKLGYPCGAFPRNVGLKAARGEYIAFLDDDDIWMPEKLELQIGEMQKYGYEVSCTEGYFGRGFYNSENTYKLYNGEHYWNGLKKIFNLKNGFPDIFTREFIEIHNPIITSSICFKRSIVDKIGVMPLYRNGGQMVNGKKEWQDYSYWKSMLNGRDCLYIKKPLFYYDGK